MAKDNQALEKKQHQTAIREKWDRIAGHYDENVMKTYREAYRLTIDQILAEVQLTEKVLEIACGTGIVSFGIAPKVASLTGVDLSPEMIANAEEKLADADMNNLDFRVADAYDLPFEDGEFDVVLIANMLYLVADPDAVMQEANRCLRPGGLLVSVTDCVLEAASLGQRLRLWFRRLTGRSGIHHFRAADIRALYERHGITIESEAILHPQPVNYYLSGRLG
ncbi:class I SAM-dependent methyltransferase [bacterium]|nr:class I SAM-dependent methyltransferase [bacterium]